MSISSTVRLKALLLTATFMAGSGGAAATDIARHLHDRPGEHDGRHIEPPGSCLDHQHRCDLGVSVAGPKFLVSTGNILAQGQASTRRIDPAPLAGLQSEPLFHLPQTRAPPGLR